MNQITWIKVISIKYNTVSPRFSGIYGAEGICPGSLISRDVLKNINKSNNSIVAKKSVIFDCFKQ